MLFFLILFLVVAVVILTAFSSFKLIISTFELSNTNKELKPIYEVKIGFYLLGKIKLFAVNINNHKTKELLQKDFIKEKIEEAKKVGKNDKQMQKEMIKYIIKMLEIESINLNILIDTTNVILTSYLVGIISAVIPNVLRSNITSFNHKNHKFKITPLYKNQNYIYIKLNSIINIKTVHIISMYKIGKKYKGGNENERASYRRLNVNCYGKY